MGDGLTKAIKAQIPQSLDDVIRKNRDLVQLRLATNVDMQSLAQKLEELSRIKDVIDDWRLVCLVALKLGNVRIMLLGDSKKECCPWITSAITGIDLKRQVVLTNSGSLYQLGKPGVGEPSRYHLVHLCAALHMWGSGDFLGAPRFYY